MNLVLNILKCSQIPLILFLLELTFDRGLYLVGNQPEGLVEHQQEVLALVPLNEVLRRGGLQKQWYAVLSLFYDQCKQCMLAALVLFLFLLGIIPLLVGVLCSLHLIFP